MNKIYVFFLIVPCIIFAQQKETVKSDSKKHLIVDYTALNEVKNVSREFQGGGLTYVPDDNFELKLIESGYDSGPLDDYVLTANIENLTHLTVGDRNISDLTGIEDFVSLEKLFCGYNNLTSLDLSNNVLLYNLYCNDNNLISLNVTQNPELKILYCNNNNLSTIDVTQNPELEILYCYDNSNLMDLNLNFNTELRELSCENNMLTSLDLSNNTVLNFLNCSNNNLNELNIAQNLALENLRCNSNNLSSLDVNNNINLIEFFCSDNSLNTIDVSQNNQLVDLGCQENNLTSLDVSNNNALIGLRCQSNPSLTTLDVRNGNNLNMVYFLAYDNPNLNCIDVDEVAYMTNNFSVTIDNETVFDMNCTVLGTNDILDSKSFDLYPNPTDATFHISLNESAVLNKVILYNNFGQHILTTTTKIVDVSNLSPGLYVVEIQINHNKVIKKIIIE